MTKTALLCSGLRWSGALRRRAAGMKRGRSPSLLILAYHRVLPEDDCATAPDPDVVSCTAGEFEREVEFLTRYFNVISFADLGEAVRETAHPLIITFDDGYRDNADTALPILRKFGARATFFVSTGYVDTNQAPWWDEMVWRVRHPLADRLDLRPWIFESMAVIADAEKTAAVAAILRVAKTVEDRQRLAMLEALRAQSEAWSPAAGRLMMSWDEVRTLAASGMEIGSHTVSHPVLGNLAHPGELRRELVESKRTIEEQTGQSVQAVSYPVGRNRRVTPEVVRAAKDAGYRYGCIYEHGVNPRSGYDPYRLLRIKAEVGRDFDRFRAKVLFPEWIRY